MTIEDVRQLMGASTPHFALQLRERIRTLIRACPTDHPARIEGEREIARLDKIAFAGEIRGHTAEPGLTPLPSLGHARETAADDRICGSAEPAEPGGNAVTSTATTFTSDELHERRTLHIGDRPRPRRSAAGPVLRRPGPARARRRPRPGGPRRRCARAGCRSTRPAPRSCSTACSPSGRLELTDRAADAAQADDIVITIGTPSFSHVESDLRQVRAAVDDLLPLLRPGHSLILRSTIAPGTTDFVAGYLEKRRGLRVGEDVFVAHAPERIAAGRFLEEISTLPCIIGGVCESLDRARRRACSACSARRSSAPRRSRPSWPRSGPTSCATRPSRCPTC